MKGLNRRSLLRLILLAAGGGVLASCETSPRTGDEGERKTSTSLVLRSENSPEIKPDWNVRFISSFHPLEVEAWRLSVEGLVDRPGSFSLEELRSWPSVKQDSRMVCVEGWSSRAEWEGFTYQTLAEAVSPQPEARWLYFECGDGYYEYLSIEELRSPRVLFVYKMDGELLHPKFGSPLRLIVPPKYGYKGPKSILRIEFRGSGGAGYWSDVGPYPREGRIQAGIDRPLDLGGVREIDGGEVTEY